jgi:hypothetical protein
MNEEHLVQSFSQFSGGLNKGIDDLQIHFIRNLQ